MKTRDIAGKTVASVQQYRFWNDHMKRFDFDFKAVYFTDGSRIVFTPVDR